MKTMVFLMVGTLIGAGSLGVLSGLKVKDEILVERHQAEEDSIAAVALASSEAEVADSAQAGAQSDSALAESAPGQDDGGETEPSAGPAEDDPGPAPTTVDEPVQTEVPPTPVPDPAAVALEEEARRLASETAERLSKIFSQMKPGDAAEVLSFLTDAEIERILLGIREKDAAPILSQLEPARAAAVSRRVLGTGRSNP